MKRPWQHWVGGSAIALAIATRSLPTLAQDAPPPDAPETPTTEERRDDTAIVTAEAERLLRQGMAQLEAGNAEAALPLLEQSLARYNLLGDGRGLASAALGVGYAYAELGETERAIAIFESLAVVAAEAELGDLAAVTAQALADLRAAGVAPQRPAAALELPAAPVAADAATPPSDAGSSASPATPATDAPEDPAALLAVAVQLGQQRRFQAALEQFQAARAQLEATSGDRQLLARALNGLGESYRHLNQPERAAVAYQQALAIARELPDRAIAGIVLHNLGSARADAADYTAARDYYRQALRYFRQAEQLAFAQRTLVNLSATERQLGDLDAALPPLELALAIARELGDRAAERAALQALVELSRQLAQPEQVARYEQQLRALNDRSGP